MLRLIILLAILGALAFGIGQLADQPGDISINWGTTHIETSLLVGLLAALAAMVAFTFLWGLLRFIFKFPSLMNFAARARRRNRGFAAISRGMVALGAGDQKAAAAAAKEAERNLKDEPLTLLLKAQSAQMSGDKKTATNTFSQMAQIPETRVLGLRGLHIEARQRGDHDAAHSHAVEAQKLVATPWAAEAVMQHHAGNANWSEALAGVERNASAKLIDKATANRQRAVLKTAIALESQETAPETALNLAKEAISLSPDLVPAAALAAKLYINANETRKARKVLEAVWAKVQHPDLATAYLNLRQGDKASERLARAETLLKMSPDAIDARLAVAKAATEALNFDRARAVLEPIANLDVAARPSAKTCIAMAALEEAQNRGSGKAREWLARAARAPRDAAWIADGIISDTWQPASPVTGKLDAFKWEQPIERLTAYVVEPVEDVKAPEPEVVAVVAPPALSPPPAKPVVLPVIFPQANAPDDPGQDVVEPKKSRFGKLFG